MLIILGVAIGTAIGVPAARQVKMTQMPQMVALFNGVGGGAVALIAWVEFRASGGFAEVPTYVAIFSCFAAIVGSVSFWGSNIAFAKLQELIDGKPVKPFGSAQVVVNGLLLAIAVACGVAIVAGSHDEILIIVLLIAAAIVGNFLVLPIGGADMPVVISTAQRLHGPQRRSDRRRAQQHRADRRGHDRRRLGHAADPADGRGDEPHDHVGAARWLRRRGHG